MHDIHAAQQILNVALDYAQKNNIRKINSMTIELGKIVEHNELITPKNLRYNIELISKNTPAENCEIIVKTKKNNKLRLVEIDGE
jgi:Zn finger protein HypA/HybF involved in hydrogenase expression